MRKQDRRPRKSNCWEPDTFFSKVVSGAASFALGREGLKQVGKLKKNKDPEAANKEIASSIDTPNENNGVGTTITDEDESIDHEWLKSFADDPKNISVPPEKPDPLPPKPTMLATKEPKPGPENAGAGTGSVRRYSPRQKTGEHKTGVINSHDMKSMEYEMIPIKGEWKYLFGDVPMPFYIMTWSPPGQGKSTLALLFARHLTQDLNMPALYVAAEEGFSYTMKDKLERMNVYHENFDLTMEIPSVDTIKQYDAIFIDSVTELGMTYAEFKKIIDTAKKHGVAIYAVFQSTKQGIFRGKADYEHLVDASAYLNNGNVIFSKNRYGGKGTMNVFEFADE